MSIKSHHFNSDVAIICGVEGATFLSHLAFWINHNIANRKNFYDNNYWTYNSNKALLELFPYWSTRELRVIIKNLVKHNLIVEGNYNKIKFDRTKWYALTDIAKDLLGIRKVSKIDLILDSNDPETQSQPICQKRQMELSEVTNGVVRSDKPIPDIKPDTIPDRSRSRFYQDSAYEEFLSPSAAPDENISSVFKKPIKNDTEIISYKTVSQQLTENVSLVTALPATYNPHYVKEQVLNDETCHKIFKEKNLHLSTRPTLSEEFDYCVEYRRLKNKPTGLREFTQWLGNAKSVIVQPAAPQSLLSDEDKEILSEYRHCIKFNFNFPSKWSDVQLERARSLHEAEQKTEQEASYVAVSKSDNPVSLVLRGMVNSVLKR